MNSAIAFFVGSITFVAIMLLKIPIKRLNRYLADRISFYEEDVTLLYRRLNGIIFILVFIVAAVCYYYVIGWLGIDHFKWCCSLKAGAIAIALYAIYEQWFGVEDSAKISEKK